jgi:cytochrome c-type biogenesis protein CcmH/NrfG
MKRLILALGFLALGVLLGPKAQAQYGSVDGQVVDQDGQPVEGATVKFTLMEGFTLSHEAKTKKSGEFALLTTRSSGPWQISVKKEGFTDLTLPEPVRIPLGGSPTRLPPIKIWKVGAAGAPAKPMTKEEEAKAEEERKAIAALQIQFKAAGAILDEADAAAKAGDAALAAQKLDEAEAAYKELLVTRPEFAQIHYNLAVVQSRKKDWEGAAASYAKAAELKPDWADAYAGASACYQNAKQMAKAEEMLTKAVAAAPENGRLQHMYGVVLFNQSKYAEAEAALKKAQALDATNPEPLYYLATIAVSLGKTNECIALLEKYIAANPTNQENLTTAKGLLDALKPKK